MNHVRILLLVVAAAALTACQPKTAATAAAGSDTSPPVAIVDGFPITRDFYEFYIKGVTGGKTSADLSPQQRTAALDNLIRGRLVEEEGMKEGIDKSGDTPYYLVLSRVNVFEQALQERYLKDRKPTEQELRAEYETQIAAMPKTEYHARHVLLATEVGAQKVVERLKNGEKFEVIAKSDSMDSSKTSGGDLGWFSPNRMMPEFAAAVIALKPGEYTRTPVHTQYGWHVIQLIETREVNPPPFDQVRQRLQQMVEAKKFRMYTDELMHNAKIERFPEPSAKGEAPGAVSGPAAGSAPGAASAPAPAAPTPAAPAPAAPPSTPAPAAAQPAEPAKN
ncbi:MAG TPA: peptidylprolyl isomerase [Steroidobacteraceae bacterium]|nr:peptidylprolyl isomerase [Steroidobacteraceae bacterium]